MTLQIKRAWERFHEIAIIHSAEQRKHLLKEEMKLKKENCGWNKITLETFEQVLKLNDGVNTKEKEKFL